MGSRKGDFQLSLGLIVTVVFAVVLLSLAVLWIQGVFPGLTGLTDDLVQDARAKIRETFSTSSQNFAIWPNQHELKPGKALRMLAGIKNNAADGKDHQFAINVIPIGASICGQDTACIAALASWLTFDTTTGTVLVRDIGEKTITLTVPQNAVQGTYLFNVVVCGDFLQSTGTPAGPPDSTSCTATSENLFSSPRPLTIIVAG